MSEISSPKSTGGGGYLFEHNIQACFLALMMTEGSAPGFARHHIKQLDFQTRRLGYSTDDLLVEVISFDSEIKSKLLVQCKSSFSLIEKDKAAKDSFQGAWEDFCNGELFSRNQDRIAIISEHIPEASAKPLRFILEQAHCCISYKDFISKIKLVNFSPSGTEEKFNIIHNYIKEKKSSVTDEEFFLFLKHLYWFNSDINAEFGFSRALIHSHMTIFIQDDKYILSHWGRLCSYARDMNPNAVSITKETVPSDIKEIFAERKVNHFPKELLPPVKIELNADEVEANRILAKFVLIGSIKENSNQDWEALKEYFELSQKEILKAIRACHQSKRIPLSYQNRVWKIKEKRKCWENLATYFYDSDLDLFQELATKVLQNCGDEQNDSTDAYSYYLSRGVAEGAAIIAHSAHLCQNTSPIKLKDAPILIHSEIFALNSIETWVKLSSYLHCLAESAPSLYLTTLNKFLTSINSPLITVECYGFYSSLVSSLELLAWHPDYFLRSCELIAKIPLCLLEGDYKKSSQSLTEIILPWSSQTFANSELRRSVIKVIKEVNCDVLRSLLINLLPGKTIFSVRRNIPEWLFLENAPNEVELMQSEYNENILFYANTLIDNYSDSYKDCKKLIEELKFIPSDVLSSLCHKLNRSALERFSEEERTKIVELIKNEIMSHKKYPDADWTLNQEKVQLLEKLCDDIEPNDLFLRLRESLMREGAEYYNGDNDLDECDTRAHNQKKQDIGKLIQCYGKTKTIDLITSLSSKKLAVFALADMNDPDFDSIILPNYLDSNKQNQNELSVDYIYFKFKKLKTAWFNKIFCTEWSTIQKGRFFTALPFEQTTWNLVKKHMGSLDREYWEHVRPCPADINYYDSYPLQKFIHYSQYRKAVYGLYHMYKSIQSNCDIKNFTLAIEILLKANTAKNSYNSYEVEELIKWIQNRWTGSTDLLIELEFAYIELSFSNRQFAPQTIYKKLASNALYFHKIISMVYKGNNDSNKTSEVSREDALNAWKILERWNIVPGVTIDGTFREDDFKSWISEAKQLCEASGHEDAAQSAIGTVLVASPKDSDLWIHKTIATELNKEENSSMRKAYYCAVRNSRGAYTVDPTGAPEKAFAKKINDRALELDNHGFSRFATTLRDIADSFIRETLENKVYLSEFLP